MVALMDLVAEALDAGVFYERDLDLAVLPHLDVTEDELARGRGKVDGGVVGLEIYYARIRVEEERRAADERAARARLGLVVGQQFGTLTLRDGRVVQRASLSAINADTLYVHYTRGNRRFGEHLTARELEYALARQGA